MSSSNIKNFDLFVQVRAAPQPNGFGGWLPVSPGIPTSQIVESLLVWNVGIPWCFHARFLKDEVVHLHSLLLFPLL